MLYFIIFIIILYIQKVVYFLYIHIVWIVSVCFYIPVSIFVHIYICIYTIIVSVKCCALIFAGEVLVKALLVQCTVGLLYQVK